jgi:tetratricopeptide (TPR) repeat protein
MRTFTLLILLAFTFPTLLAQEKEIKNAEKAVNSGDLTRASSYLQQAKRIFAAADDETRAYYYLVEAEMKLASSELDTKGLESVSQSLKIAMGYGPKAAHADKVAQINARINSASSRVADTEFKSKNFGSAASLYKIAFQATQDTAFYLNAARSYLLDKNYQEAFNSYRDLYNMGYTDAKRQFVATNKTTDKLEAFPSSFARNEAVNRGTHKNPETLTTSSKVPELLRGLTTASIHLNTKNDALALIDKALADSPNDPTLINQVFHLYRQLGANERYNAVIDKLVKDNPNDPDLFYNFGVSSAHSNDFEGAREFYKKTLELAPKHENAKVNLTLLLLDRETKIIDEMNGLGMSAEDNERYDELKNERNKLYYELLPYLEHLVETQPESKDWPKKLITIYSFIGQDSKIASLRKRLDE